MSKRIHRDDERNMVRWRLPSLNALRTLEVAARHLSFKLAAVELNVTPSAVSRQIKEVEDYLGVQLFRRGTRSLEITDEGRDYASVLREMFERLQHATEGLLDGQKLTKLTISCLPTLGMKWLAPRLLSFNAEHPRIQVRLVTSLQPVDFRKDSIDIAIRVAPPAHERKLESAVELEMINDWSGVRSQPLFEERLIAVCSPKLLERGPPIRAPQDLRRHTLLHTRKRAWAYWFKHMGVEDLEVEKGDGLHPFFLMIQAALEGRGIGLLPTVLIEDELRSGGLVPLFEGRTLMTGHYHLLLPEKILDLPKIKHFMSWLIRQVQQDSWRPETQKSQPIGLVQAGRIR